MKFEEIRDSLEQTYNKLADYWGNDRSLHDWGEDDIYKFARLVGKGKRVLDLGCASGYQSSLLDKLGLKVVGLDLSPLMIKAAKKRVPKAKFIRADMTEMNFRAKSFAGVYSRAAILHIPKELVPKVLKKVHKILKDHGIFYLALKEGEFEGNVEDERHGQKVNRFFSYFRQEEIGNLLKEAGFKVDSIETHKRPGGSTTWLKIFARKLDS